MKFWRSQTRLAVLLAIALAVSLAGVWIVRGLPGMRQLELLVYDWHVQGLPRLPADDRIVIVGMDNQSLAHLPVPRPAYPLPRTIHAQLLRELHAAGAKVVGFDVMFISDIPQEDQVFAQALRESGTVLAEIEPETEAESIAGEETFRIHDIAPILRPYIVACSQTSPLFYGEVISIRSSIVDDQSTRRYIHLSVAAAGSYLKSRGFSVDDAVVRESLDVGPLKIPVEPDGELRIRFAGPAGTFKPIPYSEVYSGEWRKTRGDSFFKDKIVLVGAVDPHNDQLLTPLGKMQGVEILAQTAQQILASNWITHWGEYWSFVSRFLLSAILALAIWKFDLRRAAIIAAVEGVVWVFAAHELFVRSQVWIDTVEPMGTLVLSLIASTGYEAARIRRVFHRFMPSQVADDMLHSEPGMRAETVEKEITIVFCDIRDSTKLGETLSPEQLEELLRQYFVAGEEAAIRLGTELDKFVGDEIMLFFENRKGYEDHAIRGIQWALAIQDAARKITESGLAGEIGFRVGVGICTGRARVGLVGAKKRVQHTVVGDPVNTASRLQTATKEVNRGIVVGESTWVRTKERFRGEDLGAIAVKGKQEPIRDILSDWYARRIMTARVVSVITAIVLFSLTAMAQVNQARVADVYGTVEKRLKPTDTSWLPVSVGDLLSPDASIRTGGNSAILLALQGRHNLRIGEQSELQLKELGKNSSYLFELIRGEIWSFVNKARQPAKYEVETPSTVLGVSGTLFSVDHDTKTNDSEVTVAAGMVSVGRGASAQNLGMGFQTKVRKGQTTPIQTEPLDRHMRQMWQHLRQNESWTTAAGAAKIDRQTESRVKELKEQRAQLLQQQRQQQQKQQKKRGR